jgi:hypothetical protein
MDNMDRRKFVKIVGIGSGIAIAGALASGKLLNLVGLGSGTNGTSSLASGTGLAALSPSLANPFTFRGVVGLPQAPLPAYASYVLDGRVNPANGSGELSRTVYAGAPEARSNIALPGLSQSVRVTSVQPVGNALRVRGLVTDGSRLLPGESRSVEILVDRLSGIVRAPFSGSTVTLNLQS